MINIGEKNNLLITYIEDYGWMDRGKWISHKDPTLGLKNKLGLEEWSYCTGNKRLLKCNKDNYVFFHTTKIDPATGRRERFITAYFMIKAVGDGKEIVPKYNVMGPASHAEKIENHYVIVGDKRSRKFRGEGLRFDKHLAKKLVFDPPKRIRFGITNKNGDKLSDLQCIAFATRNIRILTNEDVDAILAEI